MSKSASVQVPGADVGDEKSEADVTKAATDAKDSQVLQVTAGALRQLMAEAQAPLLARISQLESAPKHQAIERHAIDFDALPTQDEVLAEMKQDPTKHTQPVLTKQGWVVPETFGAHPNAPK